jgi:hypothetical protein
MFEIPRSLRVAWPKFRRVQNFVIEGEVRNVENIETFAKNRQHPALAVQPERLGYAQVLRSEGPGKGKIRRQRDVGNRVPQRIRFSGVSLVELVHQLNQIGFAFADVELIEAAARQRGPGYRVSPAEANTPLPLRSTPVRNGWKGRRFGTRTDARHLDAPRQERHDRSC